MLAVDQPTRAVSLHRMSDRKPDLSERQLLGRALKALRRGAGMTQAEAAEAYGVEPNTWRRYEGGERNLSYDQLKQLAEALGSTRDALIAERDRVASGEAGISPATASPDARPFVALRPAPGRRQTIIALDEGDAVFSFPTNLSSESRRELCEHLTILLRRLSG
jgi:transcriptional regulator with XRE-family HTH domain